MSPGDEADRAGADIAVHESRPDDDSEQTHFWNIRAYGDLAANVIASFHQGDRVVVLGKVRSYPKDVFDDKGDSYQVAQWNVDATDVAASVLWAQIPKIVRTGARHAATANQPGNGAGSRAGAGAVYHDEEPF